MIFISGSLKIMPWSAQAQKLSILLRMCLKTKMNLFACGLGFNTLVYLSATNLKKWSFKVINGNGNGSSIYKDYFKKVKDRRIEANESFLDNVTGDLYVFNHDAAKWEPFCNIGLHNRKAAQDSKKMRKYVLRTQVYRVREMNKNIKKLELGKRFEEKVFVSNFYFNHWVFEGFSKSFKVLNPSLWHMHSFNFKLSERTFRILAETDEAPVVILYSNENILATQFHPMLDYPGSMVPLRNFVKKNLHDLGVPPEQKIGSQILNIFSVDSTWYDTKNTDNYYGGYEKRKKIMKEFRHCGLTSKDKGFQFVENNVIQKELFPKPRRARSKPKPRYPEFAYKPRPTEYHSQTDFLPFTKAGTEDPKQLRMRAWVKTRRRKSTRMSSTSVHSNDRIDTGHSASILEGEKEGGFVRHSSLGKTNRKFYRNFKRIAKGEGFDWNDGWVPGYRSLFRPLVKRGVNVFGRSEFLGGKNAKKSNF